MSDTDVEGGEAMLARPDFETTTPLAVAEPILEPAIVYEPSPPAVAIHLTHPFTIDGARIRKLELRHPTFAEVSRVVNGEMTEHELHAAMAGVSVATLQALRWSDGEVVSAAARRIAPEFGAR